MAAVRYRLSMGAKLSSLAIEAGSAIPGGNAVEVTFDFSRMSRLAAVGLLRQVRRQILQGQWPAAGGAAVPVITIATLSATKAEGNSGTTAFTWRITASFAPAADLPVNWAAGGDLNSADYVGGVVPTGPTTILAGQTTATITLNVQGDADVEPDEVISVALAAGAGYTVGTPASASGVVQNDDSGSSQWPYAYPLADNFSNAGSSSANGKNGPAATPYNPAAISVLDKASGAGILVNFAVGGTTSTDVAAAVSGASADAKDNPWAVQFAGNYEATTTLMATIMANVSTIATAIGHNNVLYWEKFADSAASAGTPDWCRGREINRRLHALYPGRVLDSQLMMQIYPPADSADETEQSAGRAPASLLIDGAHMNLTGNQYFARAGGAIASFADAKLGTGMPYIPVHSLYSQASTNQTNGGVVGTIASNGSLSGCSVALNPANPDFSVSIEAGSIVLRRASATALKAAYYDLGVQMTQAGRSRTTTVRVMLGTDPADLSPKIAIVNGGMLAREDYDSDGCGNEVSDYTKLSYVLGLKMLGGDGVSQYIHWGGSGRGLNVARNASNRIDFIIYDDGSANRVSVSSSSAAGNLFNVANGIMYFFAWFDASAGVYKYAVNLNASSAGAATGTVARFGLDRDRGVTQSSHGTEMMFSNSPPFGGNNPLNAELHCLWIADKVIDFDTMSNRDLFYDSAGTKLARTLGANGAVAGVTPHRYFRGNGADLYAGMNFGNPAGRRWHGHSRTSGKFGTP